MLRPILLHAEIPQSNKPANQQTSKPANRQTAKS
jgi:hypothetical protein